MSYPEEESLSPQERERLLRQRRRNRILALIIGAFALAMIVLSYLMFSKYKYILYE